MDSVVTTFEQCVGEVLGWSLPVLGVRHPGTPEDCMSEIQGALFRHWIDTLSADGAAPGRIDPLKVPTRALPLIGITERDGADGLFRHRLAGTAMVEAIGYDPTGTYLNDRPDSAEAARRLDWMERHKTPYWVKAPLKWSPRDYKTYSTLVLPYAGSDPSAGRQVSVFDFSRVTT